jgi:lipopolysaccharide biosynthesis glycosyltransferase
MSIPIIFCIHDTDGNYWPNLAVAINSLLINSTQKLNIYVLHNETLNQEARNTLQYICIQFKAKLNFKQVVLPLALSKANFGHFSPASIYRLLIPMLFKQEHQVIYLDSDLIFHGVDVQNLIYSAPPMKLCAVLDSYIGKPVEQRLALETLGLSHEAYFNSGVLVIRPNLIEENLIENFIKFCRINPILSHPDQDFLNVAFKNNWGKLDCKYNSQIGVWNSGLFKSISYYEGKVIHYAGRLKPLMGFMAPGFLPYWMYAHGIKQAAKVFDSQPLTMLEPDPDHIDQLVARQPKICISK